MRTDDDFRREIESHIALETERLIAEGLAPQAARDAAERRFGNVTRARERFYEARPFISFDQFRQDIRYALRSFARTPGFTFVAMLTLALAIGLNTAIFSVVDSVLLRPLAFPHAGRLVRIFGTNVAANRDRAGVSAPDFADWRRMSTLFDALGAFSARPVTFAGAAEPESVIAMLVTPDFFSLFGDAVALGGRFQDADYGSPGNAAFGPVVPAVPGDAATLIISHSLWQRQFGGDPDVVGRRVQVNGLPGTIVGVMQPDAGFNETPLGIAECWMPLVESTLVNHRRLRQLTIVGRLRPGASIDAAQAELSAIAVSLERAHPKDNAGWSVRVASLHETMVSGVRPVLLILLAGVGCVLLIACANVANLFLMRGLTRSREIAVRVALGAGRSRLVRQWLTESMLLALVAGAAGLAVTFWTVPILIAQVPEGLPRTQEITIDVRVLAFCGVVTLLTGVVTGLAPGLTGTLGSAGNALRSTGADAGPRWMWLRHSLVVAQVGIAVVLLIGAGLMMRTLTAVHALDLGFEPDNVLTFGVNQRGNRYPGVSAMRSFSRELVERLEALPGVAAAGTGGVPLLGSLTNLFTVEDGNEPLRATVDVPSPGYFRALGFRLFDGRFLVDNDTAGSAPVAVVNRAFARAAWGTDRVVGRRLRVDRSDWTTVVGVVHDVRMSGLEVEPTGVVYIPLSQTRTATFANYVVRTAGDPAGLMPLVRATVRDLDPGVSISRTATMNERLSQATAGRRFNFWLTGLYSLVALILATVGVYALISEAVVSRTSELGVRMALGARRAEVMWLVIKSSLLSVGGGIVLGLAAAAAVTRYIDGMLFGVAALDPLTFAAAPIAFVIAAMVAAVVPSRRAATVDPVIALRRE